MINKTTIPFVIKTNGSITLYLNGECLTVAQDHPNYNKIVDALKIGDSNKIESLVNIAAAVSNYAGGKIRINNGQVFYGEFPVHNTLTNRIIKMMSEGFKVDHMLKFLDNLMKNSSFRASNELYTFLENKGLPITEDGCFLGYKAVRNNYTDIRTGKFDNSVGKVIKMDRNRVDENFQQDCSYGLHVGTLEYVESFGGFIRGSAPSTSGNRLLIVKVNPADVVSVPNYAGFTKMRVCEYVVIDEVKDIVKVLDQAAVYKSDATPSTPDFGRDDETDDGDFDDDGEDFSCENTKPTTKSTCCDEKKCATKNSEIDTTSPWNETAYTEGFTMGCADIEDGNLYGNNRDFSRENSYRIGYNDGYNGRTNKVFDSKEDDDYSEGYESGRIDANNKQQYGYSIELDDTDDFKQGYQDGYNDSI